MHQEVKNYSISEALKRLEPKLKDLPYCERIQLEGLVKDFGYLGALRYLDPSVSRPWNPDRDGYMVDKHYLILKQL